MKTKRIIKIVLLVVALVVIGLGVKNQATKYYLNQHKKEMINFFMNSKNEEGMTFKDIEKKYEEDVNFFYSIEPQNDMIYVTMSNKHGEGYIEYGWKVDLKSETCELVYDSTEEYDQ